MDSNDSMEETMAYVWAQEKRERAGSNPVGHPQGGEWAIAGFFLW